MSSTGGGKSKGGRGKPKSTKSVSRSSKAGLQFPVSQIAHFLRPESSLVVIVKFLTRMLLEKEKMSKWRLDLKKRQFMVSTSSPSSSGLGPTNSIKSEEEEDDITIGGRVSSSPEGNFDLSSPETPSMTVWGWFGNTSHDACADVD
ncbi:hypothetical protein RJ640_015152 [Escallonia rubra]|uniref:Uncharacterized protein n=1 Tax=Escallonia rubra TaxID=112253 RepID=A0AA88RP15_9ASTE|nr:hypothetical protein RJ640_015152 [Escallonia rubra]